MAGFTPHIDLVACEVITDKDYRPLPSKPKNDLALARSFAILENYINHAGSDKDGNKYSRKHYKYA